MATVYDTSAGTTGINVTNEQSTLKAVALNSLSDQNIDTYLLNISVDLFNKKNNAEIISKAVNVTQTGSEAAINVFGDASVKIYPDNILGNIKANTLTANPVELTAKGGKINMNVGAVRTDILNAENITAEGVKITAENDTQGQVIFTSGRLWYYHVNKWERVGEEKLVVYPKYLDNIEFYKTSNVIEKIESYEKTQLSGGNIYFLENKSTGEILYALEDSDNKYYKAIMTAGTYKQCEPAYPGDITVSASGSNISAYGAHLTTGSAENTIHFETTNGGQISVTADGSVENAYGLYTDSDGGTITALIEGSITENSNTETDLGNTAGILMAGAGGKVNIQVGVVPDEPPVREKEIKVSGSQVGIYNTSPDGQTKNVVIFGTVSGAAAPILTDNPGSSLTLAAWKIQPVDGHVAFTKESETLAENTAFETDIRYILLADPSVWDEVKIESAFKTDAWAIKENESTGTIRDYCESDFNRGFGHDLRSEHDNFYNQNLKEETETYYWAKAGETVTLKSSIEGYHITEAYWQDGTNETDKMACSDGVCTFTVSMGGGVWIHDVKTAKDAKVTITDKDGQEVKTVNYGDIIELSASVTPEGPGTWTWNSSDPSTAEVTQNGSNASVAIEGTGNVTITAEYKSASGSEGGKGSVELAVLPRPITITADAKTKVYDNDPATDPELTAAVEGAIEGDTINYTLSREPGQDAGKYPITVTLGENPNYLINAADEETANGNYTGKAADESGIFTITKKSIAIKADNKSKVYDNDASTDPELTATVTGKPEKGADPVFTLSRESGQDVGNYPITVTADEASNPNYEITVENGTFSIKGKSEPEPEPEPSSRGIDFFRIFEESQLPATGYSSLITNTLSEQPMALNYEPVRRRLQIPTLNLETELVTVPLMDDSWQVAWLGNRAGILEGSALPGEGYSFIAAHNTLNSEEYGPFALLSTMAINDLITVNSEDGTMSLFRVYANEVIGANDVEKMERVAEQEADSLVLITCENESVEGGYLDRRVIFAKPL